MSACLGLIRREMPRGDNEDEHHSDLHYGDGRRESFGEQILEEMPGADSSWDAFRSAGIKEESEESACDGRHDHDSVEHGREGSKGVSQQSDGHSCQSTDCHISLSP